MHFIVGYKNLWHLTPAFAGLAVFVMAQALSYAYLAAPDPALLDEWRERTRRLEAASLRSRPRVADAAQPSIALTSESQQTRAGA